MDEFDIATSTYELERLKSSKIITQLHIAFEEEIKESDLPNSLIHLDFGYYYNQKKIFYQIL
jgi:hypothetical protein